MVVRSLLLKRPHADAEFPAYGTHADGTKLPLAQ
jgi:hypothetical protein